MKVKCAPKNIEFKQRCKEVFQVARQTMTITKEYFSEEEERYLDRLIAINNQNNFRETKEEINHILGELAFKSSIEDGKSEGMITSLRAKESRVALPELNVSIVRGLCFKAIIHATEYMLSKGSKSLSRDVSELSLTNAYILLREVEEII